MTDMPVAKNALVTGGGSGIGRSVCLRLAQAGANIFVLDLDLESAGNTVSEIEEQGGEAQALGCDISDSKATREIFEDVLKHDPIDFLVNSAGIAHIGNIENTSEDDLDRLYSVNVKGTYNAMAAVVPSMKVRRYGVIVNVASVASSVGISDRFAYSMTKGAVLTMTYSVARDYVNHGIRCNCVAPARVHTPFVDRYLEKNYPDNRDEMFEALANSQPIGRMGAPDEIAALIAYLCSDDAAFITGANVPIDGGFVTLNN